MRWAVHANCRCEKKMDIGAVGHAWEIGLLQGVGLEDVVGPSFMALVGLALEPVNGP